MPCCDLKGEGGALDPFAASRVFAVMIYPNSLDDQNTYLSLVRADVVSAGEQLVEIRGFKATKSNRLFDSAAYLEGLRNHKPSALSDQDIVNVSRQASRQLLDDVEIRAAPAGAAGAILLRLLQIERAQAETSLNRAIWVVSETLVYKEGLEKVPKVGKQKLIKELRVAVFSNQCDWRRPRSQQCSECGAAVKLRRDRGPYRLPYLWLYMSVRLVVCDHRTTRATPEQVHRTGLSSMIIVAWRRDRYRITGDAHNASKILAGGSVRGH